MASSGEEKAGPAGGGAAPAAVDSSTRTAMQKIPLLTVRAGPRDKEWVARLKQELASLIKFVQYNKQNDNDWFIIESNKTGTRWTGRCWYVHELVRYEFDVEFDVPVAYPAAPVEVKLPQLAGLTVKMYAGGVICTSVHFKPLWSRNVPHFGIAHALALGLGPWLAAEVPHLAEKGLIEKFRKA